MLSYHDGQLGIDLPLHIRFLDARRHDSVSGIVTLKEFRGLNPNIPIQNLCFDSANDNYPTYNLCKTWGIRPFIDLNASRSMPKSIPDEIIIDKDGTPICQAGYRMVYWGYCSGRSRCKWRCPLACRKVDNCPCRDKCSKSPYGRCVYTKPEWDVRLYPPVARGTREYKKIYKNRTSCERVNNRILNDYHLHAMGIHRRKRYTFFAVIAGINIHADAWMKKQSKGSADETASIQFN
ncbi:transposase [Roseburia sp. 1XD42-69]|uniref:transposase n=1 Tax=Roseburia sp. 1XD42-69 TaxID=2320088 RepID=UPI001FAA3FDB|nr:transposase [Roseburia sp. 1XD42-69]